MWPFNRRAVAHRTFGQIHPVRNGRFWKAQVSFEALKDPVELQINGFMSALHELAANVQERSGVECRLECPETVLIRNHVVATHLFRIAQEAINNALKHGKARRVVVALKPADGKMKMTVTDDGLGFQAGFPRGTGMGLQIMKYRAAMAEAVLEVASEPGAGTTVTCVFARNL